MDSDPLFVVAIDFGTSYSGYAYCSRHDYQQDPPKVFANENWAARGQGVMSKKTPTCLLLTSKKEFCAFGYEAEDEYITLTLENKHKEYYFFKGFKMKLHGEEDFDDDFVIEDELGKPMPAIDIFSKSIKYLKEHFLKQIQKNGIQIRSNEIRWMLTVPAIWNDSAKFFMRRAAVKAGINGKQLKIALEPEAASIFCQHLKTERAEASGLTAAGTGTKYMAIDLGGGTADITVHEKLEDGKLKQLFKASGGAWGGTAVDQQFINLLTKIVGGPVIHRFLHEHTFDYYDMMREFEVTKRNINLESSKDETTNVRVPASLDEICKNLNGENISDIVSSDNFPNKGKIRKVGDKLLINKEIMQELFIKVIDPIVHHVQHILEDQAANGLSLIILAGGFAESQIVQDVLQGKFETKDRKVIVSHEAGMSVLKGAVMFGHRPDEVKSRILGYTYGIGARKPFDPQKHPESKKILIGGIEYCDLIFSIFITKGTSVEKGYRTKHNYSFKNNDDNKHWSVYSSMKPNPSFVDDEGCKLVKKVEIKSKLPKSNKTDYQLTITYIFGDTEVEMEIEEEEFGFIYHDPFDFEYK